MRWFWVSIIFFFVSVSNLLPDKLVLKGENFLWLGIYFVFPDDVVVKEKILTSEKSLHVYPARREPFFVVIRKLPIDSLDFSRVNWEKEIFWRGENLETVNFERQGLKFQIYKADQIRNQNQLRIHLWLWNQGQSNYWVWVMYRKDRKELSEFFENGLFISRFEAK